MNAGEPMILVVDDEPALRDIFSGWVESMSCGIVLTAEDGARALDLLETNDVVLLITDVRMPGMDGVNLVRRIAERSVIPSIIFVSAYTDVDEREMYSLGAETFLAKPLHKEDLTLSVMRALTDRSKLWRHAPLRAARQSVTIKAEPGVTSFTLGRGGFCARHTGSIALGKVVFDCESEDGGSLRGTGTVRWRSRSESLIGVEFTYLDDSCRENVVHRIHQMRKLSYIPKNLADLPA